MKEKTDWKQKGENTAVRDSGSSPKPDSGLMKAALAIAAGLIIAALTKGVKDSDYYD